MVLEKEKKQSCKLCKALKNDLDDTKYSTVRSYLARSIAICDLPKTKPPDDIVNNSLVERLSASCS